MSFNRSQFMRNLWATRKAQETPQEKEQRIRKLVQAHQEVTARKREFLIEAGFKK